MRILLSHTLNPGCILESLGNYFWKTNLKAQAHLQKFWFKRSGVRPGYWSFFFLLKSTPVILRYIQSWEPVSLVRKKFKIQYLVVFLKEIKGANNYVSVKMNFPPCYVKGTCIWTFCQELVIFKIHVFFYLNHATTILLRHWYSKGKKSRLHSFVRCHGNFSPLKQLLKYNCHRQMLEFLSGWISKQSTVSKLLNKDMW